MKTGSFNPVLFCYKNMWRLLDLLYPPVCSGCGKPGTRWCGDCQTKTKILHDPLCPTCGLPVVGGEKCQDCEGLSGRQFVLRSWAVFEGPVREAIHRMKYNRDIGAAENFVQYMIDGIQNLGWIFDMVIPVPLNNKRKKERGYNQAGLLAWPIARTFHVHYSPKALHRTRNTVSQTHLDSSARRINVKDAFRANTKIVRNKRILLVDDLATTCATIEACSSELINAGAKLVYVYTLARTL